MNDLTPLSVDLESLLEPVAGGSSAGEDLRYEGTYDQIQEDRREDDPTLSQGIWKIKLKKADWAAVRDNCVQALHSRTKDLQIAAWLVEAWLQLHGFSGLKEGLNLMYQMCGRYWDDLYPRLDEDSVEFRVSPFVWLNEKLAVRLKMVPVTHPENADLPAFTFADWEKAFRLENLAKQDKHATMSAKSQEDQEVTTAKILISASLTPGRFFVELMSDLDQTIALVGVLTELLDEKCGKESPGLGQFKGNLEAVRQLVMQLGKEHMEEGRSETPAGEAKPAAETSTTPAETPQTSAAGSAQPVTVKHVSGVISRAEAYQKLEEAADFLMRTEPHSPAPYLVKRAIAWGNMSLDELLQELIKEPGNLGFVYELLGIERNPGKH